jgi:hypothetical protein
MQQLSFKQLFAPRQMPQKYPCKAHSPIDSVIAEKKF